MRQFFLSCLTGSTVPPLLRKHFTLLGEELERRVFGGYYRYSRTAAICRPRSLLKYAISFSRARPAEWDRPQLAAARHSPSCCRCICCPAPGEDSWILLQCQACLSHLVLRLARLGSKLPRLGNCFAVDWRLQTVVEAHILPSHWA